MARLVVVETERLRLRPWVADDLNPLTAIFALPEVSWYPFGRGLTGEETKRFLDRHLTHWETYGFGSWAVEPKGGGRLIGFVGLVTVTWLPEGHARGGGRMAAAPGVLGPRAGLEVCEITASAWRAHARMPQSSTG